MPSWAESEAQDGFLFLPTDGAPHAIFWPFSGDEMFEYKAKVIEIVDGDTFKLEVDLGFNVKVKQTFRLARIDCPELLTIEGVKAKMRVVELLEQALSISIRSTRREKYGRWLCEFFYQTVSLSAPLVNLNSQLLSEGFAKLYRH